MLAASPEIGSLVERLGHACRHRSSCPADLAEIGILTIAAKRHSQYEWYAHERLGRKAGLAETTMADVKRLVDADVLRDATPKQRAMYAYVRELDDGSKWRVATSTHDTAIRALGGEQPLVDFVFTIGFYSQIAFILHAFEVPLPAGTPAPFPDDASPL